MCMWAKSKLAHLVQLPNGINKCQITKSFNNLGTKSIIQNCIFPNHFLLSNSIPIVQVTFFSTHKRIHTYDQTRNTIILFQRTHLLQWLLVGYDTYPILLCKFCQSISWDIFLFFKISILVEKVFIKFCLPHSISSKFRNHHAIIIVFGSDCMTVCGYD